MTMKNRIPFDGYNDDNLDAPGSAAYSCLNSEGVSRLAVSTGRKLWVKDIVITNEHATETATVEFYDEAEAATPTTPTAAKQRLTVMVGPTDTAFLSFRGPGMKCNAGLCACATDGTINAYSVHVSGYEAKE